MTDREKLIELFLAGMGFTDNKQLLIPTSELCHLADYLISHGVVVRDKGEWIKMHSLYIQDGAYKRQCSCCKKNTTNLGEPLDFCPNCGADMREAIDMSLNKAITHGKEHRKPYRGSKAIDRTCRNHGGCDWCKENRQHKFRDKKPKENKDDI